jgi:hypothetical protein
MCLFCHLLTPKIGIYFNIGLYDNLQSIKDEDDGPGVIQHVVNQIMNRCVANRLISKQEAMVELAGLDLTSCTEIFDNISISGAKKLGSKGNAYIQEYYHRKDDLNLSLKQYYMKKFNSEDGNKMAFHVLHFPGVSATTTFPITDKFAHSMLIIHKPWSKENPLKRVPGMTWRSMFDDFMDVSPPKELEINLARAKEAYKEKHIKKKMPRNNFEGGDYGFDSDEEDNDDERQNEMDIISQYPTDMTEEETKVKFHLGREFDWSKRHFDDPRSNKEISEWLGENVVNVPQKKLDIPMIRRGQDEFIDYKPSDANADQRQIICQVMDTIQKFKQG